MPDRLKLKNNFFPIQTFFNAIDDQSFLQVIENLSNGIGYGINECYCMFPEDLDPGETLFDGVKFSIFEDEIIISKEELTSYIKIVCQQQLLRMPSHKDQIEVFLKG